MKATRKTRRGESRHLLLKEFFLNASLLALLKRVGEESARFPGLDAPGSKLVPVRARR